MRRLASFACCSAVSIFRRSIPGPAGALPAPESMGSPVVNSSTDPQANDRPSTPIQTLTSSLEVPPVLKTEVEDIPTESSTPFASTDSRELSSLTDPSENQPIFGPAIHWRVLLCFHVVIGRRPSPRAPRVGPAESVSGSDRISVWPAYPFWRGVGITRVYLSQTCRWRCRGR